MQAMVKPTHGLQFSNLYLNRAYTSKVNYECLNPQRLIRTFLFGQPPLPDIHFNIIFIWFGTHGGLICCMNNPKVYKNVIRIIRSTIRSTIFFSWAVEPGWTFSSNFGEISLGPSCCIMLSFHTWPGVVLQLPYHTPNTVSQESWVMMSEPCLLSCSTSTSDLLLHLRTKVGVSIGLLPIKGPHTWQHCCTPEMGQGDLVHFRIPRCSQWSRIKWYFTFQHHWVLKIDLDNRAESLRIGCCDWVKAVAWPWKMPHFLINLALHSFQASKACSLQNNMTKYTRHYDTSRLEAMHKAVTEDNTLQHMLFLCWIEHNKHTYYFNSGRTWEVPKSNIKSPISNGGYHSRELASLQPSWCTFSPISLLPARSLKSILFHCISIEDLNRELLNPGTSKDICQPPF